MTENNDIDTHPADNLFWDTVEKFIANLRNHRLADVFRFITFAPGEEYGPHEHLRLEINYVKKGRCRIHTEDKSISFREGETMVILSDVRHRFEAGTEGTVLMQLEFLPEIFSNFKPDILAGKGTDKRTADFLTGPHRVLRITDNARIVLVIQDIINELKQKELFYDYQVVLHYAELLLLLYRHIDRTLLPTETNETLKDAIHFMRQNYHQALTMKEVAQNAHISERYLRKLFASKLGTTPIDYLNRIRINKAMELLQDRGLSIKETCFACGFHSPHYFSRVFKQQTGVTPAKWGAGSE